MPKIGRYSYPVIGLNESIAYAKTLQEKCGGEAKRETFSEAIDRRGGRFNMIVGALTDWGLVKASSGLVTITDLAKNIIFALKPEEGEVAKIEAAKKISLFVEVSERYPQIATLEQFSLFLRDKSGADLSEVKTESSTIYKIYSSAANYLKSAESSKPPQETKEAAGVKMSMISETLPDGIIATISTKDGERLFIKDQAVLDEVYDAILRARQKSKTQGDK